ncbi:MAG: Stf0 family sulfotransferase [Pseudomonadota bacterium]
MFERIVLHLAPQRIDGVSLFARLQASRELLGRGGVYVPDASPLLAHFLKRPRRAFPELVDALGLKGLRRRASEAFRALKAAAGDPKFTTAVWSTDAAADLAPSGVEEVAHALSSLAAETRVIYEPAHPFDRVAVRLGRAILTGHATLDDDLRPYLEDFAAVAAAYAAAFGQDALSVQPGQDLQAVLGLPRLTEHAGDAHPSAPAVMIKDALNRAGVSLEPDRHSRLARLPGPPFCLPTARLAPLLSEIEARLGWLEDVWGVRPPPPDLPGTPDLPAATWQEIGRLLGPAARAVEPSYPRQTARAVAPERPAAPAKRAPPQSREASLKALSLTLILALPRTGSSLLCHDLASLGGLGRPGEHLLPLVGQKAAPPYRREDVVKLCQLGKDPAAPVLGVKIMLAQTPQIFRCLQNGGRLEPSGAACRAVIDWAHSAFKAVNLLFIRRDDLVAQAISYVLAKETDVWHVHDAAGQANHAERVAEIARSLDPGKVLRQVDAFAGAAAQLDSIAAECGARAHAIRYEDYVAAQDEARRALLAHAAAAGLKPLRETHQRALRKALPDQTVLDIKARLRAHLETRVLRHI